VYAAPGGGTEIQAVRNELQNRQVLTDEQVLELALIGQRIAQHFGHPQDIEWCLADDSFYIVQSRPITTLFPIPGANDGKDHVYLSVGHQQMMTDPMKPLGLSIWQMTTGRPMHEAAGRLFVDVGPLLASPDGRKTLLRTMGQHDPLMQDALETLIERGGFDEPSEGNNDLTFLSPEATTELEPTVVSTLIENSRKALEELKRNIKAKSGPELLDFVFNSLLELRTALSNPQLMGAIMASNNASNWLNVKLNEWLHEKNVADTLSLSVNGNVTSEMGLALLDVADVLRPFPEIIEYLQQVNDNAFLDGLSNFEGGREVKDAIRGFLHTYGMRCTGEIDITRTRWGERPGTLIPLLLGNIANFEAGESKRRFERGQQLALNKVGEILSRLKQLPDGQRKAKETAEMINQLRNFSGYREYPKYDIVSRFYVLRNAMLMEAEHLVKAGVINDKEDIYYLTLNEYRELEGTQKPDYQIIRQRKDEFRRNEKLTPPRVITGEGEILKGKYNLENLPTNAIAGLAVSSGTIEGRARVILSMEDACLEDGDILVTTFTDPGWTALFVSIKGLITEVGGLMTHGAVIAREYGLPAVVGVENATKLIKDGQRIRVNGTEGYVEIL
jgi:pyruvate,water dikinase